MDIRLPLFDENETIICAEDLYNDGSYPDRALTELLIPCGMKGTVVNVGRTAVDNIPVYRVDFENKMVVGCFEEELRKL